MRKQESNVTDLEKPLKLFASLVQVHTPVDFLAFWKLKSMRETTGTGYVMKAGVCHRLELFVGSWIWDLVNLENVNHCHEQYILI
jgi:hypothetical protein